MATALMAMHSANAGMTRASSAASLMSPIRLAMNRNRTKTTSRTVKAIETPMRVDPLYSTGYAAGTGIKVEFDMTDRKDENN